MRWGLGLLVRALSWMFVAAVGLALVVAVAVPRLAGAQPFTILSSSMEPRLPPGTLIVVRPVDPAKLGVGSVVTYQLHSGRPQVVTHRVHAQGVAMDGEPVFWTKGDANDAVDAAPVRAVQVRGELWYAVPYLGFAGRVLQPDVRRLLTLLAVLGLLGYAVAQFVGAARERRATRRPVPEVAS